MLRLPRKALYALEAVVDIAFNARPDPVQAKEITRRQGIPPRYLEQVMQQLVHAGVLKGVRGPRGGYVLARERRRISVADIVTAIQALERDGGDEVGESRSETRVSFRQPPFFANILERQVPKITESHVEIALRFQLAERDADPEFSLAPRVTVKQVRRHSVGNKNIKPAIAVEIPELRCPGPIGRIQTKLLSHFHLTS